MTAPDAFLTKTLTTSGTSTQSPTGAISNGGSAVDEFDIGHLIGTEGLYFVINVTAVTGTSPTMTPTLNADDSAAFGTDTAVYTWPAAIAAVGLYAEPMPIVKYRYLRLKTGSIGGSNSPGLTFTAYIQPGVPSGRL